MINGKFFPKLLFLILSFQIISSNLKSIKKLNKPLNIVSDSQDFSQSYIDLNDPDVMEREYKKIRHYESIERGQVRHLNPLEIEESQKKKNCVIYLNQMYSTMVFRLFNQHGLVFHGLVIGLE